MQPNTIPQLDYQLSLEHLTEEESAYHVVFEGDAFGIDYGSHLITIAKQANQQLAIEIVNNAAQKRQTLVCFSFQVGNIRLLGDTALDRLRFDTQRTFIFPTRFIGAEREQIEIDKSFVLNEFDSETRLIRMSEKE